MNEYWDLIVAILAGVVQGIVEWLPVSSQGNLSLFLILMDISPDHALQLALFLQLGTTLSATLYYRDEILESLEAVPQWRPQSAFTGPNAVTSFVVVACFATGLIGLPIYFLAVDIASELSGGLFIAAIGVLLVLTGVLELASKSVDLAEREDPTFRDAVIVGGFQGLSILPGISRSGVTTSVLLFRSYQAPSAFRLSFLLSIPTGIGAGALIFVTEGGIPGVSLEMAALAVLTSAVVGYATIGILMRIVERIPFWIVCFGLGGLAIVGGGGVTLLVA
ncbi:undecaprenyl-diphosphate phosphatase [Halostagnicola sp. A-GB9-2]|uniref:undecaprenyl-diphosphate phosphatase n=1 Tax=Halostagnicola sp. A-GB9-2 TaxID=3048066 RepID=UPI0024C00227|nr:undecaprenyl-diphosphate phosphatase [Halostagnicola sp. A-GB9-2]MDJ1431898.1 undecaprenyl-diphosphate phosphatase [Halostagnicola sp. A-GB9-2]